MNQSKVSCRLKLYHRQIQRRQDSATALLLCQPGQAPIMKLTETEVTQKAGQKSAATSLSYIPKDGAKRQNITLSLYSQKWKEGEEY